MEKTVFSSGVVEPWNDIVFSVVVVEPPLNGIGVEADVAIGTGVFFEIYVMVVCVNLRVLSGTRDIGNTNGVCGDDDALDWGRRELCDPGFPHLPGGQVPPRAVFRSHLRPVVVLDDLDQSLKQL